MPDSPQCKLMRAVIVTADDFGLHARVNEAVERAHLGGILTAASLMVGAPAAADAIARARRLTGLRVGLHLVLTEGRSVLAPEVIPALVDREGRFGDAMVRDGVRFFFLPHVRAQLALEIRAQFEAFAATGLVLDHVNAHKHFHLHPTVLTLMLEIGREFGMRAIRLPREARPALALRPWIALVRSRLDRQGIDHNDTVAGITHSGHMDEATLIHVISTLPEGITEIYCHPAVTGPGPLTPAMRRYRHDAELEALLSPRVAALLDAKCDLQGGFADLFSHSVFNQSPSQSTRASTD